MSATVEKVKEELEEYKLYQKRMKEARGRPLPGLMPRRIGPDVFTRIWELEKKSCKPEEVVVDEATVHPEGDVCVQLTCPGGATRRRCFSADQTKCYFDCAAVEEAAGKKEPSAEEKTKCAIYCANSLSPTLTEQFTGEDVKREAAAEALDKLNKADEVSAELHWEKFHVFPPKTPMITDRQLYEKYSGKYFAGEPLFEVPPETQKEWEREFEEKKKKVEI